MPGNSEERSIHQHESHELADLRREVRDLSEKVEEMKRAVNRVAQAVHGDGEPGKFEESIQFRLGQQEAVTSRGLKFIYGAVGASIIALLQAFWSMMLKK